MANSTNTIRRVSTLWVLLSLCVKKKFCKAKVYPMISKERCLPFITFYSSLNVGCKRKGGYLPSSTFTYCLKFLGIRDKAFHVQKEGVYPPYFPLYLKFFVFMDHCFQDANEKGGCLPSSTLKFLKFYRS